MAGPLAGISAAQIAQQKLQNPSAAAQPKQGPSKFDSAMKTKAPQGAEQVQHANAAQAAQKTQHVQQTRQIENINKTEKAHLNKVNTTASNEKQLTSKAMDPVTQKGEVAKSGNVMTSMLSDMEKGQGVMDKLIKAGIQGKSFNQSEMLSLQAGMYKYTQELELTGKVVEKATSGLKDTLKTQV